MGAAQTPWAQPHRQRTQQRGHAAVPHAAVGAPRGATDGPANRARALRLPPGFFAPGSGALLLGKVRQPCVPCVARHLRARPRMLLLLLLRPSLVVHLGREARLNEGHHHGHGLGGTCTAQRRATATIHGPRARGGLPLAPARRPLIVNNHLALPRALRRHEPRPPIAPRRNSGKAGCGSAFALALARRGFGFLERFWLVAPNLCLLGAPGRAAAAPTFARGTVPHAGSSTQANGYEW